jgi:subtilisin
MFLANFSCFGPEIDCCAPGVGIISTVPERFGLTMPYAAMDGTSMASPAACGALAAILAKSIDYPGLPRDVSRAERARALLKANCRDVAMEARYQGRGIPAAT